MINKKAQSAMEYLMTYGWAILVVLIALGALFYLGVFSPKTPNICTIGAPFTCVDFVVSAGSTDQMVIGASGIKDDADLTLTGDCTYSTVDTIDNQENTITIVCAGVAEGDRISGDISIAYELIGSDIPHTISGSYSGTVEA